MRIVAGSLRGRPLVAPEGQAVRPTADRTREALFGILEGGRLSDGVSPLTGALVLDAFAGTGALGLEALSRGAAEAVFIERAAPALNALRANVRSLGVAARCRIVERDALHPPPAERPAGLVLLDPPYNQGLVGPALEALRSAGWIGPETLVVVELLKAETPPLPEGFESLDDRRYGKTRLLFLRLSTAE
ncbi:16S rRNA (guanine966-N2)-methyltransferase [Tistlia consotensis]|uniref:16S rRNA (Guanine966-N2)-methyltransferase n=1 Tax=Tistlia consotensis USBA 355 TaxID=560819 RepID=A0A1Y6CGC9_9PROT|nr:16S rRNA (guanine(966)-N(2))-methyltransferase RsmD [Tistlia consotensis]SMF62590.1 16S rRNA (guanine966-N2)-methyltransferase [Tistlia consotensis USBA 355]SNR94973.1 16S rRNA (guanine966-N2)-methyltransferase [Tistlia consotensis]